MKLILTTIFLLSIPQATFAYVDPGTTTSVFGLLATIISGAGVIGAFLIRPILRVFRRKKPSDVPTATDNTSLPPKAVNDLPSSVPANTARSSDSGGEMIEGQPPPAPPVV